MAAPYFKVNGVDLLPYIVEDGIEWTRNDINASDAGRDTLSGYAYVGLITSKIKAVVTCIDLWDEDSKIVLKAIRPEYVTLETNLHPEYGKIVRTMYSNNVPAKTSTVNSDGSSVVTGISFPLVER